MTSSDERRGPWAVVGTIVLVAAGAAALLYDAEVVVLPDWVLIGLAVTFAIGVLVVCPVLYLRNEARADRSRAGRS